MPLVLEKGQIEDWIFDDGSTGEILRQVPVMLDRQPPGKFKAAVLFYEITQKQSVSYTWDAPAMALPLFPERNSGRRA